MSYDVGKATEGLESSFSNPSVVSPTSQLILQPFRCFTYVTAHYPTLPLLHLRHSSIFNPYFASPTSQLILQPFRYFTYITAHSPTLLSLLLRHRLFTCVTWRSAHGSNSYRISFPSIIYLSMFYFCARLKVRLLHLKPQNYVPACEESPTLPLLHLPHSSFSNPSFASPRSQALRLRHWRSAHGSNSNRISLPFIIYQFLILL